MPIEGIVDGIPLNIPEDDGKRLIYYFLSECAINNLQALLDILEREEVNRLWRPYWLLSCKAYYQNRIEENRFPRLLDNEEPLLTIGVFLQYYYRTILGGKCKDVKISDRCLTFNVFDILPLDIPPENISNMFFSMGPGLAGIIYPEFEALVKIDAKELRQRMMLIRRKGDKTTTIDNVGTPRLCILPLKIDANEIDFWIRHFWGEYWGNNSNILFSEFGEEKASQIIEPYMKQIGNFYGDYFKNRFELKNKSPQEVGGIVHLLNRLLKQDSRVVKDEESILSCKITSCPFSKSSPFICKQMSMIYNSLCQTINKEILFEYENGLMKGEKACHWVIKKK